MRFFACMCPPQTPPQPLLSRLLAALFQDHITVERLECCTIITFSPHLWVRPLRTQKPVFYLWSMKGKERKRGKQKAGPLQQSANELVHWEMKPQELTGGLEGAISCNKVSVIHRQNAHRVRKETSLYKTARAEQQQHVWKLNIYHWRGRNGRKRIHMYDTNLLSSEWLISDSYPWLTRSYCRHQCSSKSRVDYIQKEPRIFL